MKKCTLPFKVSRKTRGIKSDELISYKHIYTKFRSRKVHRVTVNTLRKIHLWQRNSSGRL